MNKPKAGKETPQSSPFLTYQKWRKMKDQTKGDYKALLEALLNKDVYLVVRGEKIEGKVVRYELGIGGKTHIDIETKNGDWFGLTLNEFERYLRKTYSKPEKRAPKRASAREPASVALSILGIDCPELRVGEWGRLLVKLNGSGTASLSLEGDLDWLAPGVVELSGVSVVEVPVRSRTSGELPVRVVAKSSGSESSRIIWLKVVEKAGKCPSCGAPVEPGAKYCWKCGARLKT
jgi:hypothetical protein